MSYSTEAIRLLKPEVVELPRLADRVSFLHLDLCRVRQDDTGVVADMDDGAVVHIPVAGLSVLLLGPGTSLTAPAAASLYRAGTNVIWCSAQGAVAYGSARPLTSRAVWAQAQARMWVNPDHRRTAARLMFSRRFPGLDWPADAPVAMMRGLEGSHVKSAYRSAAKKAGLTGWRRETDSEKATDPVNPLLNIANAILYGAALGACSALGLNPGLGVIHQGSASALLFDIADMHKTKAAIPIAFSAAGQPDSVNRVRRDMRDYLVRNKVLKHDLELLVELFTPYLHSDPGDLLLGDGDHPVPAGRNYGT